MEIYINIASTLFLTIAILLFEIGYRKNKTKIFINGFEVLILAIFTILLKYFLKVYEYSIEQYVEFGGLTIISYYIVKHALIYTKKKRDELKNLSDIKEIVKENPIKKETKRKNNKKVEN